MLQRLVADEPEPVVVLTQLLRVCRDKHRTLWEHHADPGSSAGLSAPLRRVADAMPPAGTASVLDAAGRGALSAALTSDVATPAVVVAHALAELLDQRFGHAFVEWFRERSPYQPAVGDPISLDSPDLRQITALPATTPPWRLANRLDETRHVRLAGAWATQFRVVFNCSAYEALTGLSTADTVIATCHPNDTLTRLGLAPEGQDPTFPLPRRARRPR